MKKILFFTGLLVMIVVLDGRAQHFVGLTKPEAMNLASESGFVKDKLTVNQRFNYLKFINSSDTKTLIVFFSDKDIVTNTRTICDYSEYDFMVKDFNNSFEKIRENEWEYLKKGEIFTVTLEEKEWYFVVKTKKKIKKVFSNG